MPPKKSASKPRPNGMRIQSRDPDQRRRGLAGRQVQFIDYKNVHKLTRYLSNFARILPRRLTGNSQRCQRMVEIALKRARFLALMPYTLQHVMPEGKGPK